MSVSKRIHRHTGAIDRHLQRREIPSPAKQKIMLATELSCGHQSVLQSASEPGLQ
jgi:hypothetical protein